MWGVTKSRRRKTEQNRKEMFKWTESVLSEWVIVVYRQLINFSGISWWEQVNFQRDDDDVRFVLDQHTYLDVYSASSLKQQSVERHVVPLGHIILILNQPVFAVSP